MSTEDVISVATRIQRRRDFTAHFVGFTAGTAVLIALHILGLPAAAQLALTITVWATALSCQHFRHVLRGPVTRTDIDHETKRLTRQHTA